MAASDEQYIPRRPSRRSALELLRKVRTREVRPGEVSREERRVCVAYLRLEGYTQDEIAEIFQVHRHTIARDERAVQKEMGRLVDKLDVRAMAGGLVAWARHITAKAIKEKDYALAWKIQRELVADLQALGYLPKAAELHDVRIGTFVDLARLAGEREREADEIEAEPPKALPAPEDDGGERGGVGLVSARPESTPAEAGVREDAQ